VQKIVSEIQADHHRTKEEIQNLRETNKILTQKNAHQRQKRDHLLKEQNFYKQELSNFTLYHQNQEDYDYVPDTPTIPGMTDPNSFPYN